MPSPDLLPGPYLFISGHDFRSKRKANVHFITDELVKLDTTRVFSLGFSHLSKLVKDARLSLWSRSNTIETASGVDCYLWKTFLHPVNPRTDLLEWAAAIWFRRYARSVPATLDTWIRESNTIIIESGMGIILFDHIKALNPQAVTVYLASDSLTTIGCDRFIVDELARAVPRLDYVRIPSPALSGDFPGCKAVTFVPHGLDVPIGSVDAKSPYGGKPNAVSVGPMLFDRSFFELAAAAVPELTFHVIGGGVRAQGLRAPNIKVYDEMPFADTLAYIKHADVGIAAYQKDGVSPYLTDTSMKLMQYSHFGIPAVCPGIVVGSHGGRFGYEPGDGGSIATALRNALGAGRLPPVRHMSWNEVTERVLAR